ncbi:MAG: signal peptidase II [Thermomicrobiales bacterium]
MVVEPSDRIASSATRAHGFDLWPVIIAAIVVVIDQISKALVIRAFGPPEAGKSKVIIPRVLDFRHDENTGAAFSLFQGRSTTLLLIGVIVIGVLIYYYRALPQGQPLLRLAVGGVLGGAVGNIIDRVRLGHVTDWIHITHYPTFNVADSCITVGMVTLAIALLFLDRLARRDG